VNYRYGNNFGSLSDLMLSGMFVVSLWDGSDWFNSKKNNYIMQDNGLVKELTMSAWQGGDWSYRSKAMYTYTGSDQISSLVLQMHDGTNWKYAIYQIETETGRLSRRCLLLK